MTYTGDVARITVTAIGIAIFLLIRRIMLVKGMFIVVPHTQRFFRVCLDSVFVHVGTHTYVVTGWVSNYDPWTPAAIHIGKYCSINSVRFVLNGDHNHKHDLLYSTYPFADRRVKRQIKPKSRIDIGNDVWIGQDAMILGGVKVGDGAIVGAASVVTKNVPPYAIVAGNPAVVVKMRYDANTIRELLEIRWWDKKDIHRLKKKCAKVSSIEEQLQVMKHHF